VNQPEIIEVCGLHIGPSPLVRLVKGDPGPAQVPSQSIGVLAEMLMVHIVGMMRR